jgi:hypothetical protein
MSTAAMSDVPSIIFLVSAELVIHSRDLRRQLTEASGMIARHDTAIAVSGLPAAHGLARAAGPQLTIEECGDSGAPTRTRGVTAPRQQAASVLGRPSGVRSTGSVAVPVLPPASDRHPRHDHAMAPRPKCRGAGPSLGDAAPVAALLHPSCAT